MRSFYSLTYHLVEAKHILKKEIMEDTMVWNRVYNPFLLLLDSTDMSQSAFTVLVHSFFIKTELLDISNKELPSTKICAFDMFIL